MRVCFLILAKCVLLCLALARVPLCTIYNLGVHAPIQTHNPLVWLTMDMQMRSSSQLNTPLDLDTHVYHTPSPPDVAHCGHVAAQRIRLGALLSLLQPLQQVLHHLIQQAVTHVHRCGRCVHVRYVCFHARVCVCVCV